MSKKIRNNLKNNKLDEIVIQFSFCLECGKYKLISIIAINS